MEGGHTHEWENVVVFVKDDKAAMVAGSCHGEYEKDNAWTTEPRMEGKQKMPMLAIIRAPPSSLTPAAIDTHAKVVYHKDGGLTHCFRMGNKGDDDIENEEGVWYRSPLVGWMGWPGKEENYPLYYSMIDNWSGGIGPKIDDEKFGENLAKAQGSFVSFSSTPLMRPAHTDSVDSSPSSTPTSMSDGLDLCISAAVRRF